MKEHKISESYLADCCGVCKLYLHQSISGTIPLTQKLHDKIDHVFKNIEIEKNKKEEPIKTTSLQRLKNMKKKLGCSYKEIAENTKKPYTDAYIYKIFTGRKILTNKVESQMLDAFYIIACKQKEKGTLKTEHQMTWKELKQFAFEHEYTLGGVFQYEWLDHKTKPIRFFNDGTVAYKKEPFPPIIATERTFQQMLAIMKALQ
jgi:hypothetical protein